MFDLASGRMNGTSVHGVVMRYWCIQKSQSLGLTKHVIWPLEAIRSQHEVMRNRVFLKTHLKMICMTWLVLFFPVCFAHG